MLLEGIAQTDRELAAGRSFHGRNGHGTQQGCWSKTATSTNATLNFTTVLAQGLRKRNGAGFMSVSMCGRHIYSTSQTEIGFPLAFLKDLYTCLSACTSTCFRHCSTCCTMHAISWWLASQLLRPLMKYCALLSTYCSVRQKGRCTLHVCMHINRSCTVEQWGMLSQDKLSKRDACFNL